jgi:hypothetical protein
VCACVCLQVVLCRHFTTVGVPLSARKGALCRFMLFLRACVWPCGALRVCAGAIVFCAAAASCFMQSGQLASLAVLAWGIWCWGFWRAFLLYQYLVHAER